MAASGDTRMAASGDALGGRKGRDGKLVRRTHVEHGHVDAHRALHQRQVTCRPAALQRHLQYQVIVAGNHTARQPPLLPAAEVQLPYISTWRCTVAAVCTLAACQSAAAPQGSRHRQGHQRNEQHCHAGGAAQDAAALALCVCVPAGAEHGMEGVARRQSWGAGSLQEACADPCCEKPACRPTPQERCA